VVFSPGLGVHFDPGVHECSGRCAASLA
jgi:hypothetical protein